MLGLPLGLLYANAGEWLAHKYLLHGLGKRKRSFYAFHFHEHHRESRKHGHVDPSYERSPWGWNAQSKEALALAVAAAAHLPLLPAAPFFTGALWWSIAHYYRVHKRSHRDPAWAREHLPWHYDHHMGPDQEANWCVSFPWFDRIMGTRKPYVGTERERAERARHERNAAAALAALTTPARGETHPRSSVAAPDPCSAPP
jgi:sterol desaturase/sphingolipid hydroxylase (fatty acid hydroxylase superfamily)